MPTDTAELLLKELALHLSYSAEANGSKSTGRPVGCLALSKGEGDLWKRIIDVLGGEPDMIRDVEHPAVTEGQTMQSQVRLRFYINLQKKAYAVFSDPQGGPDFILSHRECQDRLRNLQDNSWSVEETEKALNGWPK